MRLPCPSARIVLGTAIPDDPIITVRAQGRERQLKISGSTDGDRTVEIALDSPETEVELSFDRSGYLTFLGYEAPARRDLG